jgi:hypothetical protein
VPRVAEWLEGTETLDQGPGGRFFTH